MPLGHVTVSLSIFAAAPRPKCTRGSSGRKIARAGHPLVLLPEAARHHLYLRADAVAVGFVPDQLHRDPVIRAGRSIVQQKGRRAQIHDEDVDLAVVIVIGEGGAAAHALHLEEGSGRDATRLRTSCRRALRNTECSWGTR